MSTEPQLPEIRFDTANLYQEEVFTDRTAGTIRRLVPMLANGAADPSRPVLYSGQTQLLTPGGVLPLGFEMEAAIARRSHRQVSRRGARGAEAGHRGSARDAPRSRSRASWCPRRAVAWAVAAWVVVAAASSSRL